MIDGTRTSHADRGWSALRWALILTCAYFAVRGWVKATRPIGSDFTIYYDAARAALGGRDPLSVERYLYLPVFAVLLAPLALLPYGLAAALWQALSLAALLACVRRSAQLCHTGDGAPHPALICLPLLVILRLIDSNLANGQVNAFTLLFCLAAFGAVRAGKPWRAGAWIALGAATKLLPAFLLLPALLRRRGPLLGGFAVAFLSLVVLVPAPLLGWSGNLRALAHWRAGVVAPYERGGEDLLAERPYVPGQSLTAAAYRLLAPTPATSHGEEDRRANLLDWSPRAVHRFVLAASVLLLLAVALALLRRPPAAGSPDRGREEALLLLTPLLLAPLVHKAHVLWSLHAFTYAVAQVPRWRRSGAGRGRLALTLVAALLIGGTTPALWGRASGTLLLSHNAIFFGVLALWSALLIDTWRAKA